MLTTLLRLLYPSSRMQSRERLRALGGKLPQQVPVVECTSSLSNVADFLSSLADCKRPSGET